MKKTLKRILATFLTVIMLLSALSLNVFAIDTNAKKSTDSTTKIESTNDFSKILMSKVETEESQKGTYGITEITIVGKNASVHAVTPDNCKLVVAVYSEDMQMLGCGIEPTNCEKADYSISLSSIIFPAYYIIKGFVLDENNAAVCDEYVSREHTEAFKEFMELTVSDFNSQNVLNFDNDKTNNFAVLKDGTIIAKTTSSTNIIKGYDEKTDTYVISNADSIIKSLKSGDTLCLKTGNGDESSAIISVKSISVSGNTVTIVSDSEAVEEIFECIKIDSTGGLTETSIENAQLGNALSNIKLDSTNDESFIDLNDESTTDGNFELTGKDVDVSDDFSKSLGASLNYKCINDENKSVSITGSVVLDLTVSVKIYYDAKLFKEDYFEYRLSHTEKLTLSASVTGKISINSDEMKISLAKFPIPSTPLVLSFELYPIVEISGSSKIKVSCTSKFTQTYNPYDGQKEIQEKDKDWDADFQKTFTVKFGYAFSMKLTALEILEVELSIPVTLDISGEEDGLIKCLLDKYHYCDICVEGDISINIELTLSVDLKITKKLKWTLLDWKIAGGSIKVCDFYISTINGKKSLGFATCPYKFYKVNFKCSLTTSELLENVTIKLNGGQADTDGDGKLDSDEVKTNKNGEAVAYYEMGTYTAKAISAECGTETVTFTVDADTPSQIMWFTKNNQDNPGDDPDDISGGSDDDIFTGNESVGDVINFGSYPQSKVNDAKTISQLDSVSKSWKSYGYYSGTGSCTDGQMQPSDYMKYADFIYNGSKYRAVTFSQYRPFWTGKISSKIFSTSYTFQDDNGYYTGNVYYFKYEPLKWRVLDASEGLVMCNTSIDAQAYNNYIIYSNGEYYGNSAKTYYASDWANSSIRAWLNNDFYSTAFTSTEKSQIGTTYNENKSSYSSQYDSANTSDKIFLLSYNEVTNSKYGFSSSSSAYDTARQLKSTDYAKCQGCWQPTGTSYLGNSWWRLRSPNSSDGADIVDYDGSAYYISYVYDTDNGIVPAFKFNPKSTIQTNSTIAEEIKFDANEASTIDLDKNAEKCSISYSSCIAGNDYILLNVLDYGEDFKLSTENLLYIDQLTANEKGKVSKTFIPKCNDDSSTILLIGDFGNGIEARKINKIVPELKLSTDSVTLKVGESVTVIPSSIKPADITIVYNFSTENKKIATIASDNGIVITGAGAGETRIHVYLKNKVTGEILDEKFINVTVKSSGEVTGISVNDLSINYKDTAKLNPQIKMNGTAKYKVTYDIVPSAKTVVTVSDNGEVYGYKKGVGYVDVTVTDELGNSFSDTAKVTVSYAWWQWIIKIVLFGFIWY